MVRFGFGIVPSLFGGGGGGRLGNLRSLMGWVV